ncbi:MAG: phenylalanine--tRNA ligase subunit beta [Vicinamibacterales bacterium]
MRVAVEWLRELAGVDGSAAEIAERLGHRGFEVASVDAGVIDFEVTANRPDCLSMMGFAREAAAAWRVELTPPAAGAAAAPGSGLTVPVTIEDKRDCGRYAMQIADVTPGASPAWLAARLEAAGVRPISNVVDISNYVMLEMGHPTHAFDLATLGPLAAPAQIIIRRARRGETLVTLDGQTRELDESVLVIADAERAVAIAGVMGGAGTEVRPGTTQIAVESAWFQPARVRVSSKRTGLKTEASARFERGADIEAPPRALQRFMDLLVHIGAGAPAGPPVDVYPVPFTRRDVMLRRGRIAHLLGAHVSDAEVHDILPRLGFQLRAAGDGWQVEVPGFRVDIEREADLIEEVGRHAGYDRLPASFPALRAAPRPAVESVRVDRLLRRVLTGAGLHEAVTFSFLEARAAEPFADGPPAAIQNPLSEKFAILRPSLLPGLIDSVAHNRRRETRDVQLFEIGRRVGLAGERRAAAWVITGARETDHWSQAGTDADFYDAVGIADLLGAALGVAITTEPADGPWIVPGRGARLMARADDGAPVAAGLAGELRPAIVAARGVTGTVPIFAGEIDLDAIAPLMQSDARFSARALPKFPSITRDLSVIVDEALPARELRGTIRAEAPPSLVRVREFDRYRGKGVPEGHISLSIRLTFRDAERTLTDEDVQPAVDRIIAALAGRHGARLR